MLPSFGPGASLRLWGKIQDTQVHPEDAEELEPSGPPGPAPGRNWCASASHRILWTIGDCISQAPQKGPGRQPHTKVTSFYSLASCPRSLPPSFIPAAQDPFVNKPSACKPLSQALLSGELRLDKACEYICAQKYTSAYTNTSLDAETLYNTDPC